MRRRSPFLTVEDGRRDLEDLSRGVGSGGNSFEGGERQRQERESSRSQIPKVHTVPLCLSVCPVCSTTRSVFLRGRDRETGSERPIYLLGLPCPFLPRSQ